jgi:hypothetical protein
MKRHALIRPLFALLVLAIGSVVVLGQDKVDRRAPKAEKSTIISGKILEENVAGVKMKVGGKEELIPSGEIQRVYYDDVPVTARNTFNNLFIADEKDLPKTLKDYKDFREKIKDLPPASHAKRYVAYRVAMLEASLAGDDAARDAARSALQAFAAAHPNSWEYPYAARQLARLQLDKGDFEGAQKTLDVLAKSNLVPADIKQEADLMLVDVLFRANKVDQVKQRIDAALKDPKATEAQKARFTVYQIGLEAQDPNAKLEDVIKKLEAEVAKTSTENSVKALAYNVMGDCYTTKNRPRDAMWSYLWVDVVYSQDKGEHLKAMTRLLKIFEDLKDAEKVQIYKDKLARSR